MFETNNALIDFGRKYDVVLKKDFNQTRGASLGQCLYAGVILMPNETKRYVILRRTRFEIECYHFNDCELNENGGGFVLSIQGARREPLAENEKDLADELLNIHGLKRKCLK